MPTASASLESQPRAAPQGAPVGQFATWSLVENGGMAVLSAAVLVVFARYLSPEAFGLFAIVLALVEVLSVVVGMLFHDALIQVPNAGQRHLDSAFTVSVLFGLVLLGFVWVAGPALGSLTGIGMAGPLLVFTSFSLPLGAASTVLIAWQRRTLDFRPLAIRSVLSRLVGGAIGVAVTALGHGVWGLGAQWVAMACANLVLLLLLTPAVPRPGFYRAETTQLLRFGVHVSRRP